MIQYKCGHKSEIIIIDSGALSIVAYLEWSETVGSEGTREKCWACWCEEGNQSSEDRGDIHERKSKGITFIAGKPDSFIKFYELVKENIFKPAAMALPSADELKERIRKGLAESPSNTDREGKEGGDILDKKVKGEK